MTKEIADSPLTLRLDNRPLKLPNPPPDNFKPEDFLSLSKEFKQNCNEVKGECINWKNILNKEMLYLLYNNLSSEAQTRPDIIQKLNDYYCLIPWDFWKNLFTQMMLDPKIRQIIWSRSSWDKFERILNELMKSNEKVDKKDTKDTKETNNDNIKKQSWTEKRESEYNKNLKWIWEQLEKSLWITPWLVTRIIEQESLFWTLKINGWKSTWIMQLNSDPFKNMMQIDQSWKYEEYFSNLPSEVIDKISPEWAKNVIKNIIWEYSKENFDKKTLSSLFSQLHTFARWMKDSKDYDILNMVCWSITLAFSENYKIYKHNNKWEKTWLKKINLSEVNNFSTESSVKNLINHKWYILSDWDKKNVATILKDIKTELNKPWENQTKIDYLTAREYNWSSTKNSYAMNVLVSKKLNELRWEKSE